MEAEHVESTVDLVGLDHDQYVVAGKEPGPAPGNDGFTVSDDRDHQPRPVADFLAKILECHPSGGGIGGDMSRRSVPDFLQQTRASRKRLVA